MPETPQPQSQAGTVPPAVGTTVAVVTYDGDRLEQMVVEASACPTVAPGPGVTWVNVTGLADTAIVERIGECFQLHPLVIEDLANTDQRVKVEDFDGYLCLVLKLLYWNRETDELAAEQVTLVLGPNWVLTFQETQADVLEPVRERLKNPQSHLRKAGADYLAYALLDAIVDRYFEAIERLGEDIEGVEDELVTDPTPDTLQGLHRLKRQMVFLRKAVWPLREVVGSLERRESPLIGDGVEVYLRDVYDHTVQVIDTIEAFRDMLSGMLDIYLSSVSNRMNAIMKVLTIIATIFIPLSFLAGVYGMNLTGIPEYHWPWAYPVFWGICLVTAGGMLVYFRRKRWL